MARKRSNRRKKNTRSKKKTSNQVSDASVESSTAQSDVAAKNNQDECANAKATTAADVAIIDEPAKDVAEVEIQAETKPVAKTKSTGRSAKKKTPRKPSKKTKPVSSKASRTKSSATKNAAKPDELRTSEDVDELIDSVDSLVDEIGLEDTTEQSEEATKADATTDTIVEKAKSKSSKKQTAKEKSALSGKDKAPKKEDKVVITIATGDDEEKSDTDDSFESEFAQELAKEERAKLQAEEESQDTEPEVEVKHIDTSNHADILARLDKVTAVKVDTSEFDPIDEDEEVVVSSTNKHSAAAKYLESTENGRGNTSQTPTLDSIMNDDDEPTQSAGSVLTESDADAMLERFELTAHRMVTQLDDKMNVTMERWMMEFAAMRDATIDGDTTLDWETRRERLLAKYDEADGTAAASKIDQFDKTPIFATDSEEVEEEADDLPENTLVDTLEILDETQSEKIAELKADLTSKLREAEIELSINRAKLSQLQATLEAKQVEIERRESYLRQKFVEIESAKSKGGFFDRWSRHLTFRKKKQISDLESSLFNIDDEEVESTSE